MGFFKQSSRVHHRRQPSASERTKELRVRRARQFVTLGSSRQFQSTSNHIHHHSPGLSGTTKGTRSPQGQKQNAAHASGDHRSRKALFSQRDSVPPSTPSPLAHLAHLAHLSSIAAQSSPRSTTLPHSHARLASQKVRPVSHTRRGQSGTMAMVGPMTDPP